MTRASYSVPELTSTEYVATDQKVPPRSILAAVIAALHHSRRLQARRTLLQYEHLIARPGDGLPRNLYPISEESTCSNENISPSMTVPEMRVTE
jgi:hypothetical protein